MGILYSNADLMIKAKKDGKCFNDILTIGHLKLFLTKKQLLKLSEKHEINIDIDSFNETIYSDKFFKVFLGAKNIQSLDYSDYENCNIVHDMNNSIGAKYHEKFDIVIDGGSLEHIFNFPIAVSNCMNMLKRGGSLFIFTMANNHLGHGFYQFSPELFFRIFQNNSGFEIVDILLEEHKYPGAELTPKTKIYKVTDPYHIKERVGLVSKSPVLMLVHAIRKEIKPIFKVYPIQSDYISAYEHHKEENSKKPHSTLKNTIKTLFLLLPQTIQYFLIGKRQLIKNSFKNHHFYTKINK